MLSVGRASMRSYVAPSSGPIDIIFWGIGYRGVSVFMEVIRTVILSIRALTYFLIQG